MDTAAFLARVLPGGNHYLAWPSDKKTESGRPVFSHHPFVDISEALARARSLENNAKDAYFALASFKVQKVLDTAHGYMKAFRKQENVSRLKCLYLDVDFKQYQTELDAVNGVKSFLQTTGIVKPTIVVNSGGGLHLYWVLDRELALADWQPLATALATLGQKQGLKADFGVTIDSARVLRVPGTLNFKYTPPRACKVVSFSATDVPYEQLRDFLDPYTKAGNRVDFKVSAEVVQLFGGAKHNADLIANYDAGRSYLMAEIVAKCPVLSDVIAREGAGDPYPFWKDVLHLAAYTADGPTYIHALSRGHKDYDPQAVEERFQESLDVRTQNTRGPTTCARFSKHSSKCLACSYWGHIKSPISLGMQQSQSTAVADVSYVIGDKTFINVATDDGTVERRLVCNTALQNFRYGEDSTIGAFLQFEASAQGMSKTITIECSQLADQRYLRSHLAANSVAVFPEQIKLVERIMYSWLERLRDRGLEAEASAAFGWVHHPRTREVAGFAYAGEVQMRDGKTILAGLLDDSVSDAYGAHGQPNIWNEVAARLVADPRPEISVILATAFAAPLMRFSQAGSFTVSICSRASGVGKSTALACAQAVWGHPTKAANALHDTPASIARKMAQVRDLPSYWDELRMRDDVEAFVKLVFQLNQGKERQRLNSSARLKRAHEINTFLVVATNTPLMGAMLEHTKLSDAGAMRLFEFDVPAQGQEALDTDFGRLIVQLREHHGHAGLAYARYLVKNYDEVVSVIAGVDKALTATLQPRAQERFWFQGVACMVAGAILAKRAGIVDLDAKRILDFCKAKFASARMMIAAEYASGEEMIVNILTYFANDVLISSRVKRPPMARSWSNQVLRPPRANIVRAQVGVEDGLVWIPAQTLEVFAAAMKMNLQSLRQEVTGRFQGVSRRGTLGAGTIYNTGQVSLFEFSTSVLGSDALSRWGGEDNDALRSGV